MFYCFFDIFDTCPFVMRTSIKEGVNNCVTLDSATIKGAIPDLDIIA